MATEQSCKAIVREQAYKHTMTVCALHLRSRSTRPRILYIHCTRGHAQAPASLRITGFIEKLSADFSTVAEKGNVWRLAFHVWSFAFGVPRFVFAFRFAFRASRLAFRFGFRASRLAFRFAFRVSLSLDVDPTHQEGGVWDSATSNTCAHEQTETETGSRRLSREPHHLTLSFRESD